MVSSSSTRTKVFISYSHKDAKFLDQLAEHLAYYERNNLIEVWSDKNISPGAQWHEEIKQTIEYTKVAVLLISPSFLASRFIAENELPPLLHAAEKEGAIILPIIVRSSYFEDTELANFQAVNSPSIPVARMKGYQRDAFWTRVVREIKKAVTPQQTQSTAIDNQQVRTNVLTQTAFQTNNQKILQPINKPVETSHVLYEAKPMNTDMRQFKPGDRVYHATYGQGIVLASRIEQGKELVRVKFNNEHPHKLLSSDYLKHEQLSNNPLITQSGQLKYEQFNRGDKVRHEKFGEGTVLKSETIGKSEFVEVKFQGNHGLKRLSMDYTLLEKI